MVLTLIRHTSLSNMQNKCYGNYDANVSEKFLQEADIIKSKIKNINPELIFSSSLKRCTQLTNFLFEKNYKTDDRIKEMNFGNWENKLWKDIPQREIDKWSKDILNFKPPGGESLIEMKKRVLDFYSEIIENNKETVIVTHGGVIKIIIANFLQMKLENSTMLFIDYGGISQIKIAQTNQLIYFNR